MTDHTQVIVESGAGRCTVGPGKTLVVDPTGSARLGQPAGDVLLVHDGAGGWSAEALDPAHEVFVDGEAFSRLLFHGSVEVRLDHPDNGQRVALTTGAAAGPPPTAPHPSAAVPLPPEPIVLPPESIASPPVVASTGAVSQPTLVTSGLSVETHGKVRLDRIDLELSARSFLAVLGTSGAGKSTLLKAITGMDPATSGHVMFEGLDLYDSFDEVRQRIGYVPQDDILHTQLTVRETLDFAAQLRFPSEVGADTRSRRIDQVIDELGLSGRADGRIDELSGGQRKRVNVAVELLTEPTLLILDEPTSGLDPGNERSMMELLRRLADEGRVVIVVTHSVESLQLCDRVLFLGAGGVPVFLGPPSQLAPSVGASSVADVFSVVENSPVAPSRGVPDDPRPARLAARPRPSETWPDRIRGADGAEIGRQMHILSQRYLRVLASDRRSLSILLLQAPVMAVLMLAVFGSANLDAGAGVRVESGNVLMALVLGMIYLGAANAVREIVKERSILRREQNFGLSIVGYLGSKFIVLGVVTIAQGSLLVIVGTLRQSGPTRSVSPLPPHIELLVLVVLCGLSALALGLVISAAVNSADKAMTLLPVMLFAQFLLAGLVFPLNNAFIQAISWLTSARWGFAGSANTVDYWSLRGCGVTAPDESVTECTALWRHELTPWLLSYSMLLVLGGAALVASWILITRRDPASTLAQVPRSPETP